MKIKIENEKYKFVTDNSQEADFETAFLLTEHNQKYKKNAQENSCEYFVGPEYLYKK
jgi:hypothetical protein